MAWVLLLNFLDVVSAQCTRDLMEPKLKTLNPSSYPQYRGGTYGYREPYIEISPNVTLHLSLPAIQGEELERMRTEAEEDVRARGKTKIYFLHVHKAGGTNLCNLASTMRLAVPPRANCNPKLGDYRVPERNWFPIGCLDENQLMTWSKGAPWKFIANEFFPHFQLPPPAKGKFAYVTVIRDPLDRVLSHYLHERRFNLSIWQKWATFEDFIMDPDKDATLKASNGLSEPEYYPSPFGFFNYHTYMLTGCKKCGKRDLEIAKRRLDYFSAVIIKESYEETYYAMAAKFGWAWPLPQNSREVMGRKNANARKALADSPKALAILERANRIDLALYKYARQRASAILKELPPPPSVPAFPLDPRNFHLYPQITPPPPPPYSPHSHPPEEEESYPASYWEEEESDSPPEALDSSSSSSPDFFPSDSSDSSPSSSSSNSQSSTPDSSSSSPGSSDSFDFPPPPKL